MSSSPIDHGDSDDPSQRTVHLPARADAHAHTRHPLPCCSPQQARHPCRDSDGRSIQPWRRHTIQRHMHHLDPPRHGRGLAHRLPRRIHRLPLHRVACRRADHLFFFSTVFGPSFLPHFLLLLPAHLRRAPFGFSHSPPPTQPPPHPARMRAADTAQRVWVRMTTLDPQYHLATSRPGMPTLPKLGAASKSSTTTDRWTPAAGPLLHRSALRRPAEQHTPSVALADKMIQHANTLRQESSPHCAKSFASWELLTRAGLTPASQPTYASAELRHPLWRHPPSTRNTTARHPSDRAQHITGHLLLGAAWGPALVRAGPESPTGLVFVTRLVTPNPVTMQLNSINARNIQEEVGLEECVIHGPERNPGLCYTKCERRPGAARVRCQWFQAADGTRKTQLWSNLKHPNASVTQIEFVHEMFLCAW